MRDFYAIVLRPKFYDILRPLILDLLTILTMMTFSQYLAHIGFFGTKTPEEWTLIREEYRKHYQREYQKERKKQIKRVEIQLASTEYEMIKKIADSYDDKPTSFMRKAVLSFVHSKVYLPVSQDLEETKYLIRKSSNNINQIIYGCHRNKVIYQESLNSLVAECNHMESTLNAFYQKPKIIFKPINLITNAYKDDV